MYKKLLLAALLLLVCIPAYAGRNGSGTYTAPSNSWNPAVSGQTLSSADWNTLLADLETAITNSIAVDGQTTITASIPFNSNKITGLAAGTAAADAAPLTQIQGAAYAWIASPGGTADAITGTLAPTPTAYTTGMRVAFVAAGANTTAVTINISSLGVKNVTKNGTTALAANDILSGQVVYLVYDGTRFQLQSPLAVSTTVSPTVFIFPAATSPAQTAEGSAVWDSDDDLLTIGDGSARKTMVDLSATQTITGTKTFTNVLAVAANSSNAASVTLAEDTDNGVHTAKIIAPAAITSNRTYTGQDADGTLAFTGDIPTSTNSSGAADYTPTLTNTTNVAASTAGVTRYFRYGNYVTVFGQVQIDATGTGTSTVLGMSLPIASNFAQVYDAGGTASSTASAGGVTIPVGIVADVANDRVSFIFFPNDTPNLTYSFCFTYLVI